MTLAGSSGVGGAPTDAGPFKPQTTAEAYAKCINRHGHTSLAQTSTYLNATSYGLRESMQKLDDARCNPVATEADTDDTPSLQQDETPVDKVLVN